MKTKSSVIKPFTFKTLFVFICALSGFAGTIKCDAQSIIGKWHRTGTIAFKMDKTTGKQIPALSAEQQKQYDQAAAANEYNEVLEFKSDNTYVSTVSAKGRKPMEHIEKYSLSGNKLDMNIAPVHNEKPAFTIKSVDGATMVLDMLFMGKLTEIVYKRM